MSASGSWNQDQYAYNGFPSRWFRRYSSHGSDHRLCRQNRLPWSYSFYSSNLWVLQTRPHHLLRAGHVYIHNDILVAGGKTFLLWQSFQHNLWGTIISRGTFGWVQSIIWVTMEWNVSLLLIAETRCLPQLAWYPYIRTSVEAYRVGLKCERTYPSRDNLSLRSIRGKEDGIPDCALRHCTKSWMVFPGKSRYMIELHSIAAAIIHSRPPGYFSGHFAQSRRYPQLCQPRSRQHAHRTTPKNERTWEDFCVFDPDGRHVVVTKAQQYWESDALTK